MPSARNEKPAVEFHPVTPDRWPDLVRFFEHHGNPNYCWCMRWRLSSTEFRRLKSVDRKRALGGRVRTGIPIGILGYLGCRLLLCNPQNARAAFHGRVAAGGCGICPLTWGASYRRVSGGAPRGRGREPATRHLSPYGLRVHFSEGGLSRSSIAG